MDDARNAEFAAVGLSNRTRSGSATNHKRDLSGTFLSRLPFLRMSQTTSKPGTHSMDQDGDGEDVPSNMPQITREASERGKAMAAVIQQQRRTRRRRGSLRKTALLGTRLESRDKKTISKNAEVLRTEVPPFQGEDALSTSRSPKDTMAGTSPLNNGFSARGFEDDTEENSQPSWFRANSALKVPRPTVARRRQGLTQHANNNKSLLEDETATDDDDLVSFPRINTSNNPATGSGATSAGKSALQISTTSNTDPYYSLEPDAAYRPIHRKSSPLATHPVEMKNNADITWDYSETEWWGWIILMVTWLVFVVGIGSCFEVWSWAWDVGETPYAPPELEDDPTLPIVGYYPALIILTAVMSWVWVVVAWVGMKYFKHANISGDDS